MSLLNIAPSVLRNGLRVVGALAWSFVVIPCNGLAEGLLDHESARVAERVQNAWESGALAAALEMLDEGLLAHPHTPALHKLRGDILATSRRYREAVQAYDTALADNPAALDIRWAKWSVLIRWGQGDESVAELRRMAQIDARNPLIHLRLAQELRKLDRLEESLAPYRAAVELAPGLLSWRLGLARARFDVLDYQGAADDVGYVLARAPVSSQLGLAAQNLQQVIEGQTTDRGRRARPAFAGEQIAAQRKEWAAIRADAWNLFSAGRYQEAEPVYRRVLALNPSDAAAAHQLGITLMQLGRCEDALHFFQLMSTLDPGDEEYADTVFRMGQCLVELERWEDAFVHFQILYQAAVEFEESNKGIELPPGTRVLDKHKLLRWLDKVRPHVPDAARLSAGTASDSPAATEEELFAKIAAERLAPQKPLDKRASLLGRDADFSWFRFVIPAGKVMRDDFPTGAHEFIPLNPGQSFPATQQEIYLVFGLVSASYDAVPLSAQCYLETADQGDEPRPLAQDQVMMSMNDQSGYFVLSRPGAGWAPGLYRCGLFAGERTSAYTHVDEVRFQIVEGPGSSSASAANARGPIP